MSENHAARKIQMFWLVGSRVMGIRRRNVSMTARQISCPRQSPHFLFVLIFIQLFFSVMFPLQTSRSPHAGRQIYRLAFNMSGIPSGRNFSFPRN
jgi:hypothetical protein